MSKYFTKLGLNSKVLTVVCIDDTITTEEDGIDFLNNLHNYPFWKQTYKDGTRKNYASIGFTYDEDRDAFIPSKTYPSWTLNESICLWEPPVAFPDDGKEYGWDEATTNWTEIG